MNKVYLDKREPMAINIGGKIVHVTEVLYLKDSIEKMIKEYVQKQKEYQK